MKNIIPFTKEITFDNKISEITSISLEENYDCTSDTIDGEFKVFGEYKTHELSINKETFEHKLPFSVDLTEKIDINTLNFEITDFSYDILNDNVLKVNIEFKIEADELQETEENFEEALEVLESDREPIEEIKEQLEEKNDEERIEKEEEDTILDSVNETDTEFTTYHIHVVKEAETIESICALYNSNPSILAEYNDLNNFKIGDKLIVVESDE